VIVVDTSALMALVLAEPTTSKIKQSIRTAAAISISAVTLAETLVVARRRSRGKALVELLNDIDAEVVPVTAEFARKVADAYDRWGKGVHPAGLNFADCFAYALAKDRACPLLFVGEDFAKTDVTVAIQP
jgi:ribonuclease VapC